MRDRTYWVDHVLSTTDQFTVVGTGRANVYTITPYGTVMQEGTFQDAAHFNSLEEGVTAIELALQFVIAYAQQNKWDIEDTATLTSSLDQSLSKALTVESGSITLTNTLQFPFNNSKAAKALAAPRDNSNYIVVPKVTAASGNVGEIVVSEQLENGFKIEYTGSAPSVTLNYTILGGWNK